MSIVLACLPPPRSPHVYWWNGTGDGQLTHVRDDGTLTVHVSPGFQSVLRSITTDG
jgi:hypothetical protein